MLPAMGLRGAGMIGVVGNGMGYGIGSIVAAFPVCFRD